MGNGVYEKFCIFAENKTKDLLANWQLCQNGEEPRNIEPLK
jgi:hypothetical protein